MASLKRELTDAIVDMRLYKEADIQELFERIVAAEPNDKAGVRALCAELAEELEVSLR
jgi:hypothetical protein